MAREMEIHAVSLGFPDLVAELHEKVGRNVFQPVCKDVHTQFLFLSNFKKIIKCLTVFRLGPRPGWPGRAA